MTTQPTGSNAFIRRQSSIMKHFLAKYQKLSDYYDEQFTEDMPRSTALERLRTCRRICSMILRRLDPEEKICSSVGSTRQSCLCEETCCERFIRRHQQTPMIKNRIMRLEGSVRPYLDTIKRVPREGNEDTEEVQKVVEKFVACLVENQQLHKTRVGTASSRSNIPATAELSEGSLTPEEESQFGDCYRTMDPTFDKDQSTAASGSSTEQQYYPRKEAKSQRWTSIRRPRPRTLTVIECVEAWKRAIQDRAPQPEPPTIEELIRKSEIEATMELIRPLDAPALVVQFDYLHSMSSEVKDGDDYDYSMKP